MKDLKKTGGAALALAVILLAGASAQAAISSAEQRVLDALDADKARAELAHLTNDVIKTPSGVGDGSIVSGSVEETAMAEHIAAKFRKMGLGVRTEEYPVRAYRYDPVTLRANGKALPAISLHATLSTWGTRDGVPFARGNANGGHLLRVPLIDAGDGYETDYQRIGDVRGKAVLVRREMRDWPPAQITEAAQHGAAAIIFYDHPAAGPDQANALRQDSLWGHENLPTVATSVRAARELQASLKAGAVQIELDNHMQLADGISRNVVATLRGSERPDEWVVVAGHFDRWFQGSLDDTSGAAAVLEVARAFTAAGFKPRRSMLFVAAGSEEAGQVDPERDWLAGSYAFVQRHPEVLRNAALIFNVDGFGWSSKRTILASSADLLAYHRELIADLGLESQVTLRPTVGSTTDAWNFGVLGGAGLASLISLDDSFFPLYHTQLDIYAPERFRNMGMNLRVLALDLARAANLGRLPVDLRDLAAQVDGGLAEDAAKAPDVSFADARAALDELQQAAATLTALPAAAVPGASSVDTINHLLMSTRHFLTPWLYADNGEYDQAVRTSAYVNRIAALDRALAAAGSKDREAVGKALAEFYEGRQCQRLSAPVYAAERNFWAGEGGWASRYGHRAAPPPPAFDAGCRALRGSGEDWAMVTSGLTAARDDARITLVQSLALMATKTRAAAAALNDYSSRAGR
jgi:Zn-dependent M28 family amino/carboxypeptidase